ncbi:MAG: bifunctional folylpolyglutamate synthase/dihydrofolate synthase [Dysgonamonadaceae bacterium]|jgi:dihydrofolate synthase/folylpolyglutamate synthase|nr:bifunctional folylpolyglutamate synthase/dihydrofolate synthase [Dysgonamonadaceae bacterium]
MNYKETVDYLYMQTPAYQKVGSSAYKPGLNNSLRLDVCFRHPHQKYKTIHVAGTNGKGSVSHTLAAILQQSGYRVGLYTSPHLIDFRERIRVNGKMISERYVVDFVEEHREIFEPVEPSFFELTMEMAFCYFADEKVDVAVVEVGLGGRLDSTNIISPDLSIITNIGFDHTQYLGDTLAKIAFEKAGIIKPGVPVVIGEATAETRPVFKLKAGQEHAPIIFAEEALAGMKSEKTTEGWLFSTPQYPQLKGELGGYAQTKNARTLLVAIEELKQLNYNISDKAVYDGFARVSELTGLMGRWQVLQTGKPKIVCDTGHNAHGIRYIAEQLKHEQYDRLHIVFGMVNDKDIRAVLELLPKNAVYYFTKASVARALDENKLATEAGEFGLRGTRYATVPEAVAAAQKNADENDFIFIGGSSFVVADALETNKSIQS